MSGQSSETIIGTTNAGPLAWVDGRGRVSAVDGAWTLDWWVGADDRWHLPADETAVRQRLVESTPVVETSMRVPGGDAVARQYGTRVAGVDADLVAVDVANETSIPFALALVVTGDRHVRRSGTTVVIDDDTLVELAREPSRWAVGDTVDEIRGHVLGGDASDEPPTTDGRAVALLFPLAHTARLGCTIATGPTRATSAVATAPPPAGVNAPPPPDADRVARGWRAQLDRGLGVRMPDGSLTAAVDTARATLLLAASGPVDAATIDELATLAGALVRQGFADEALGLVVQIAARQRLNGRFGRGATADAVTATALVALGDYWRHTRDARFADELAGPVAKAAHRIGRRRRENASSAPPLSAAADLLDGAGQPEAAAAVRALAGPPAAGLAAAPAPVALDALDDVGSADSTSRDRYATGPAHFLDRVRTGLVDDRAPSTGAALMLLGGLPAAWKGQPVEVHAAATRHGRLSCALRWHGERPALLWELDPWPDADPVAVRLSAPALDPAWSSVEPKGEALLAAPAPPSPPDLQASFS